MFGEYIYIYKRIKTVGLRTRVAFINTGCVCVCVCWSGVGVGVGVRVRVHSDSIGQSRVVVHVIISHHCSAVCFPNFLIHNGPGLHTHSALFFLLSFLRILQTNRPICVNFFLTVKLFCPFVFIHEKLYFTLLKLYIFLYLYP